MTQKPQIGKTIYKQQITRGINSNRAVLKALRGLHEECRTATASMLVARAAISLQENLDALHELERIGARLANRT